MSKFLVSVNYTITSRTGLSINDVQNMIDEGLIDEYSCGTGTAFAVEVLLPDPQELAKDICSVQPMKNWD